MRWNSITREDTYRTFNNCTKSVFGGSFLLCLIGLFTYSFLKFVSVLEDFGCCVCVHVLRTLSGSNSLFSRVIIPILYNCNPENVGKCKDNMCVCVCVCMCVWCLCGGRGTCIISSPTWGSWLRPQQANTHGLELPSRIGTLHNHISKLQVTKVNV